MDSAAPVRSLRSGLLLLLGSTGCKLFREEADAARWTGHASLSEEDVGVPDSLTEASEAEEFPLTDSVRSVESEDEDEEEAAAGGDEGEEEEQGASAEGDDGGDNPFFSEECEERDSWLPVGVVPGLLLLNVSPCRETPETVRSS